LLKDGRLAQQPFQPWKAPGRPVQSLNEGVPSRAAQHELCLIGKGTFGALPRMNALTLTPVVATARLVADTSRSDARR